VVAERRFTDDCKDETLKQLQHVGKAVDLSRHCFSAAFRRKVVFKQSIVPASDKRRRQAGVPWNFNPGNRFDTWVERPDDAALVLHAGTILAGGAFCSSSQWSASQSRV
jgi:hypothetical protein